MHGAAEAAIGENAVAGEKKILQQHDAPGQPKIAVAGLAGGIDIGADVRARRADQGQKIWRREKQLEVDVSPGLDVVAKKPDVVRESADLELVDKRHLRRSLTRKEQCGRDDDRRQRGTQQDNHVLLYPNPVTARRRTRGEVSREESGCQSSRSRVRLQRLYARRPAVARRF